MLNRAFEFHYQNATLPPPFANQLQISIVKKKDIAQIHFEQKYLYRDEISNEEILEHGYPLDEEYTWDGDLPIVWFDASITLFKKTTLIKDDGKIVKKEPKVWIKHKDDQGVISEGMPGDPESWEYFLQEFIQAVYEKGKMEKPLVLRLHINTPNKSKSAQLIPSFVNRNINVIINEGEKDNDKTVDWWLFRIGAKHIFALDFIQEKSIKKTPEVDGLFIDPGDGLWYKAGLAAKEPQKKLRNIETIREILEDL